MSIVERLRAAGCVYAEDEARLLAGAARDADHLEELVLRRCAGEPLEPLLGWADFCGLRVEVAPGVFVPRQRSRVLVVEALRVAPRRPVVLDLCCGSGAVGVAFAAHHGYAELHAVDVHPAAVRCATRNAEHVGGRVYLGDLYEPLPRSLTFDVIVANAPYVPTDAIATMPPEARDHEPRVTLDGGTDGLDVARRVVAGAPARLRPGGHLLVETSRAQADALTAVFEQAGLAARVVRDDDVDGTAVVGRASG